jgi:protein-L-isoaspartate(D-aspartate) O-methyltransferase
MRPGPDDLLAAVVAQGVTDERLLHAFRALRRADFVPPEHATEAYEDRPIPIPRDQVTTQPSLSARMIDALDVHATDRALEVGTGYGFQTALLARLAAHVVSVERWPELAEQARANLARHGVDNVEVVVGDGSLGVPEAAPFDVVLVSAAFTEVPPPLAEQLVDGGRLVQPIGPGGHEAVTLFRKVEGRLRRVREVVPARFVRLIGDRAFPDHPGRWGHGPGP